MAGIIEFESYSFDPFSTTTSIPENSNDPVVNFFHENIPVFEAHYNQPNEISKTLEKYY